MIIFLLIFATLFSMAPEDEHVISQNIPSQLSVFQNKSDELCRKLRNLTPITNDTLQELANWIEFVKRLLETDNIRHKEFVSQLNLVYKTLMEHIETLKIIDERYQNIVADLFPIIQQIVDEHLLQYAKALDNEIKKQYQTLQKEMENSISIIKKQIAAIQEKENYFQRTILNEMQHITTILNFAIFAWIIILFINSLMYYWLSLLR